MEDYRQRRVCRLAAEASYTVQRSVYVITSHLVADASSGLPDTLFQQELLRVPAYHFHANIRATTWDFIRNYGIRDALARLNLFCEMM